MEWPSAPTTTASGNSTGSGTTVSSSSFSVTAGDLIYVAVSWEGADTTIDCSDGGVNTYAELYGGAHGNNGSGNPEPWQGGFWVQAATTTTLTITITYGAARTFKSVTIIVLHPDSAGMISLDGTPTASGGISSTVATGNNTTSTQSTNAGVSIVGYSEYGTNPTNEQINATAADNVTNNGAHEVWMLRYTNGYTGQGTADLSFNNWAAGIASFKLTALDAPPLRWLRGDAGRILVGNPGRYLRAA